MIRRGFVRKLNTTPQIYFCFRSEASIYLVIFNYTNTAKCKKGIDRQTVCTSVKITSNVSYILYKNKYMYNLAKQLSESEWAGLSQNCISVCSQPSTVHLLHWHIIWYIFKQVHVQHNEHLLHLLKYMYMLCTLSNNFCAFWGTCHGTSLHTMVLFKQVQIICLSICCAYGKLSDIQTRTVHHVWVWSFEQLQ